MTLLSIIIPVYNEEKTIERLLDRVFHALIKIDMEVIVVNDGSKDSTPDILNRYKDKFSKSGYGFKMKVIHKTNGGKGSAVYCGLQEATGDIIGIQDADLEYYPEDYQKLIEPILKGEAKVVYGSRFMYKYIPQGMCFKNWVGNLVLNLTAWIFYGFGSTTDLATCYKFWSADLIKKEELKCEGFEFCPVHFGATFRRGIIPYEVPIKFNGRDFKEGKKINTQDGFYELWTLVKERFK